ncbi:hypothetical protein Y032_0211g2174 [Ancylostoma ceylanicum]|uniref:Leucine Rich repeat-containing domain protein n=1 Tax=Ancylostoma ceylanicum TaxID=53326 RepID=A0A016SJV8_9BILA|nr:hypothetical protein Y032_0211g2174 [Ancylostoma ceylanicum]
MSIKFFSGLQDLLGLYDASIASTSHSTAHIPPSNGLFSPPGAGPSSLPRRKSAGEHNHALNNSDDDVQISKCSHERKVRFDDEQLISGYCEASAPTFASIEEAQCAGCKGGPDVEEILKSYRRACQKAGIPTIASVERQVEKLQRSSCIRQEVFSLKGERVSAAQMEALEEVFRRVQFDTLDFEYTFLDDDAAISLSEMFEFYESALKLNLSFNKQITIRGWTDVFKAVKNSNSLQMLNLRYTSLSEKSLSALCRMLRGTPQPVLGCLHLENVNLFGRNLYSLVCALKFNTVLKELYLGENSIQSADGAHLYQLILNNFTIQMIDLRNNQLGDGGVAKMCEALRNPEVIKKSSLTALVLWNNKITAAGMDSIAAALCENPHLETLNIGSNQLGEAGVQRLRPALGGNGSNLRRLGLQNTQMTCQSAILLAECLADNSTLIRVDLRDNPGIGSAGLLAIHSAMKINGSISLLNLDQSCIVATNVKVRAYQEDFRRYYEDIKRYCERNKLAAQQKSDESPEVATVEATVKSEEPDGGEEDTPSSSAPPEPAAPAEVDLSPSHCQPPPSASSGCSRAKKKFMRSSSLTCAETVADINERIQVMAGSSNSLDETNSDSTKTIKKTSASTHGSLGLAEWGSLPAIPQASETTKPVVRKLRRFSVSPSSSTFDVTTTSSKPATSPAQQVPSRPTSLAIGIPNANTVIEGPLSAPIMQSLSLPEAVAAWSPTPKKAAVDVKPVEEKTSEEKPLIAEQLPSPQQKNAAKEETSSLQPVTSVENSGGETSTSQIPITSKQDEKVTSTNQQQESDSRSSSEEPRIPSEEEGMKDVRVVIADLVNYVVYEETSTIERKRSLLLQTTAFSDRELCSLRGGVTEESPQGRNVITPSRMVNIAEEVAEETDEMVVSGVVRSLIREVLKREKEELRNTLDRRRRRTGVTASSSTPV